MSLGALLTGLGHEMVSGGLGGPGDVPPVDIDPCPVVRLTPADKTRVVLHAAAPTRITIKADCKC
jgi:hypothetical protein